MSTERCEKQIEIKPITHQEEGVLYDRKWFEEKADRHIDNLEHFTGYWHGTFFWKGVAQKKKEKPTPLQK